MKTIHVAVLVTPVLAFASCQFNSFGLENQNMPDSGQVDANVIDGGPNCGDKVIQPSESCDGSQFGGKTCVTLGFLAGQLLCNSNCTVDTSACTNNPDVVCKRPITIVHSGGADDLTNFPVRFSLPYATQMKSQFEDVRFGTDPATVPYSYFLENIVPGSSAEAWVKIPTIQAGSTTVITMYYGGNESQSESNPASVFEYVEDFEQGSLTQWETQATEDVFTVVQDQAHSGTYSMRTGERNDSNHYIFAQNLNLQDIAIDAWWRISSDYVDLSQFVRSNSTEPVTCYETNLEGSSGFDLARFTDGEWAEIVDNQGVAPVLDSWFKVTLEMVGQNIRMLINDQETVPSSDWFDTNEPPVAGTIGFRIWRMEAGHFWWIDDVRVRKAANPEPTVTLGTPVCQ